MLPGLILNLPISERRVVLQLEPGAPRRDHLGSAIRGVIGHRTLDALCVREHRLCAGCDLQVECPHARLYDPKVIGIEGDPPPPWRLLLRDDGVRIEVTFRTFGDRADELSDLLATVFVDSCQAGQLDGARIRGLGLTAPTAAMPLSTWLPTSCPEGPVTLATDSPLELKVDGRILRAPPSLAQLVGAAARRADLLTRAWSPPLFAPEPSLGKVDLAQIDQPPELVGFALVDIPRESNRQGATMTLFGVVGDWGYPDVPAWARRWLDVAAVLGVGRQTVFGFGAIRVWSAVAARPSQFDRSPA